MSSRGLPIISLEQANRFTLRSQHLLERAAPGRILEVTKDICGLQAQIPTVPALSLWAREE